MSGTGATSPHFQNSLSLLGLTHVRRARGRPTHHSERHLLSTPTRRHHRQTLSLHLHRHARVKNKSSIMATTDNTSTPPANAAPVHSNAHIPVSSQTLANYRFPTHRLKSRQSDPTRTPLVLVACGSFSPITYLHLRMFEMAADYAKFNTNFEVMGGYLSPVSDAYQKHGLASAYHRLVQSIVESHSCC